MRCRRRRPRTPDFVTRQLAGDELAAMLQRAGDFIKSGDLSSARLLLRAAEAGSEEAALTLAGTFDPNILAVRVFQDGAADIALARLWYERAAQFGSPEAPRRLRLLANNSLQ
jgi:TPR repeat protein